MRYPGMTSATSGRGRLAAGGPGHPAEKPPAMASGSVGARTGTARRRRERFLRQVARHERMTLALDRAEREHHSAQPPRGATPLLGSRLEGAAPSGAPVGVGRPPPEPSPVLSAPAVRRSLPEVSMVNTSSREKGTQNEHPRVLAT